MSKLSDTTKNVRRLLIYFGIFCLVVILFQFITGLISPDEDPAGSKYSPYASIDNALGPITYPEIPTLAIADESKPSFKVDGQFQDSPNSVNVYEVARPRETLGSTVKARDLASILSLPESYTEENNTLIWQQARQRLEYQVITGNAKYYNLGLDLEKIQSQKPEFIDSDVIEKAAQSYISGLKQSMQIYPQDTTRYLNAKSTQYQLAQNIEKSNYIRKDYYMQIEFSSLKDQQLREEAAITEEAQSVSATIYGLDPFVGQMNITFPNQASYPTQDLLTTLREFNHTPSDVLESNVGVYDLKTYEEAWEDVKDGKGSLRFLVKKGADPIQEYSSLAVESFTANPKESDFGYYLPEAWTGYIYPIYIFRGTAELTNQDSADFIFYVPAISK